MNRRVHRSGPQSQAGVTLLELLVVVALVAVLLGLAAPSYRQYLQRGHRIDAARALYAVAACQERVRARTGQYDTTRCLDNAHTAHYRVAIVPPAQSSVAFYTAMAVPRSPAAGDECGSLTEKKCI